ncbi:MAG: saccharopine dehydrogenase NADP-binding domain-containing protein, partial [Deltaproteobacteria bacterium]|nr:saccharopine dehydrogenase NADP-binding domain-containing protein [Deltaproteobacteria bacterium]
MPLKMSPTPAPLPRLRVDEVLERLQTKDGQQVVAEIVSRLKPVLPEGQLEADLAGGPRLPRIDDQFDRNLAEAVSGLWIRGGDMPTELPAAIAELLLPLTDGQGTIDAQQVQRSLGPQGLRFLERLAGIDDLAPADQLADRRALDPVTNNIRSQALANAPFIAPRMAALEFMVKELAEPDEFKGLQFMGLQHLFASSATLFDALHRTGIEYGDMRFIGKIYSTNFRAAADLERRGAEVDAVSKRIFTGNFSHKMAEQIDYQLRQMVGQLRKQLEQQGVFDVRCPPAGHRPQPMALLIDDGAEAIKLLHEKFPEYAPYFVCVEQTRRGARIVHEMEQRGELKCPVANVAESWAKLEHESPMIGHSVVLEVSKKLDRLLRADIPVSKEALVIGCGSVGSAVARAMIARGQEVHLWDKDPARAQQLAAALESEHPDAVVVMHADKHEALRHGGVLVSCVGMRTIFPEDHAFLPDGAVLVNAASADDELGPQDLTPFSKRGSISDDQGNIWQTFMGHPLNVGMGAAPAHSDVVVKLEDGRELLLVGHGFVVNMTGERDPIPPRYIQLTRSLLLLGALAAKRAGRPGIVEVPRDWQQALVNLVKRELKRTGEDLDHPSWD